MLRTKKLRVGDWVEVRSKDEILRTLDKSGQLEGLPFMPQMFQYCGKRFQVYKRAHKTCDTVNPTRSLRVSNTIHLDLRCDGKSYGGCGAACLIYWKTAWLKTAHATDTLRSDQNGQVQLVSCTERDVIAGTRRNGQPSDNGLAYVCQATQVPYLGPYLPWWDLRQYWEDYVSGNVTLRRVACGALYSSYYSLIQSGIGLGRPLRWLYDKVQSILGGVPFPRRFGTLSPEEPTPTTYPSIQPGDLVRVKSHKEILSTLNTENKNRGLYFDAELVPFCGNTFRVRSLVERFIDERTGRLVILKNPSVILEGASCQARYSYCRMFCPRGIYGWWREIWLEKLSETPVCISDRTKTN